jgi:DedD protein
MEDQRKRRIVGSVVLVLVAIILFPLFFNGEGYSERHLVSKIPPPPVLPQAQEVKVQTQLLPDTSAIAEPQPIKREDKTLVYQVKPTVAVDTPVQAIPEEKKLPLIDPEQQRPELDAENVPVAWTLQLASFKDEANAKALRKQLVSAGHKVYLRKSADLYKVYVGPDMQRDRLESLKATLKSDFALDGIIIRFTTQ